MKTKLIGLSGYKQSGKSTVAKHLRDTYNFLELSWAFPLKEIIGKQIFKLSNNDLYGDSPKREEVIPLWGKSPRKILQEVGTDLFRNKFDKDFWVKITEEHMKNHMSWGDSIVVSDCRFPNEAESIKKLGGKLIRIIKVGGDPSDDLHESELALDSYDDFDFKIVAIMGDLQSIYNQLKAIISQLT